ncbi:hypothetical protein ACT2FY_36405 [Paraburkholderia fungorum]
MLGFGNRTAYCVVRTAMFRFARMWASEPPQSGVTANVVGPGPTESKMFRQNTPAGGEAERTFLSEFSADGVRAEAAPAGDADVAAFLASFASAWRKGEPYPTRRKQPKAKPRCSCGVDWLPTCVNAWPLTERCLIAKPSVPANLLMDRLAAMFPEAYGSQTRLRTCGPGAKHGVPGARMKWSRATCANPPIRQLKCELLKT